MCALHVRYFARPHSLACELKIEDLSDTAGAIDSDRGHIHFELLLSGECLSCISLIPRPRGRREKWPGAGGVCTCVNDSGNFSRTSPIMDKLHVVVMWRNNQTRYTACSVAAVF